MYFARKLRSLFEENFSGDLGKKKNNILERRPLTSSKVINKPIARYGNNFYLDAVNS